MTLRVLIADDNRDAADSLAALVQIWGHEARVAYDGASALAQVIGDPPEVVLADLAMPSLDGRALAERLRAAPGGGYYTLVAVTGYAGDAHRDRALAAGFDHYLVKPVEPTDLQQLLEEVERRARAAVGAMRERIGRADQLVRAAQSLVTDAKNQVRQLRENSGRGHDATAG